MKKQSIEKHYAFDLDDNLLLMETKIIYFRKPSAPPVLSLAELPVSTDTFALTRSIVGVKSKLGYFKINQDVVMECKKEDPAAIQVNYKDYEIIFENDKSFRQFRDSHNPQALFKDFTHAVSQGKFGPSWQDMIECLNNKISAKNMTIITARGHAPKTFYDIFKILQQEKIIKYLPLKKNIFPVSFSKLKNKVEASNPSVAKKEILFNHLDLLEKRAIAHNKQMLFGFSDDDAQTIKVINEGIEENCHRWPNIKIHLYYTAHRKEKIKPTHN